MYIKMYSKTSMGMIQTSVLISPEFNELRKEYKITLSEALRVGLSILLAEKGVREYDNNLNVIRKLNKMRLELEKTSEQYYKLKDKLAPSKYKNKEPQEPQEPQSNDII